MLKNTKASAIIYILLLINLTLIIGYVVFNNVFILNNNINIGKNAEEVFTKIFDKANIALESVRKYNSNGNGFTDFISCPTNVTMSGTYDTGSLMETGISTQMVLDNGSIYCRGYYNSDEFRIYYNSDYSDFIKAYYDYSYGVDIVDLDSPFRTSTGNLLEDNLTSVTSSGGTAGNAVDDDPLTEFESIKKKGAAIIFELDGSYNLGKMIFTKEDHRNASNYWNKGSILFYDAHRNASNYWNKGSILFYDASMVEQGVIGLSGMKSETYRESTDNMFYQDIKYVKIQTDQKKVLDLLDVYLYSAQTTGSGGLEQVVDSPADYVRKGVRVYNDNDYTLISFDGTGIGGGDNIDDNFNSDDYSIKSDLYDGIYYFTGFEDDDIVPRKVVFGSVDAGAYFNNIYWTNYNTIDFIDQNINNDDNLNIKAGDVDAGYMYLDISYENDELEKSYDLKILEFDRDSWKDEFTLFPLSTLSGLDINNKFGYISQSSTGSLYLSPNTGSGYVFDFKNKDYALFLTNYADTGFSYRLSAETSTGAGIYINPIDDSDDTVLRVLANDIIIGGEKNFIGEEFIVVGDK